MKQTNNTSGKGVKKKGIQEDNASKSKFWAYFEAEVINEGISKSRIKKLRTMFNTIERELKLTNETTKEEIKQFIGKLNTNTFKRENGADYSGVSRLDMKKFIKQYYRVMNGGINYPDNVVWIKTKLSKDDEPEERPIATPEEVRLIASKFENAEYRIMTLLLFDSGFRISELLSVKKKGITWEEFDEEKKENCFWIECTKSKTIKRKVPVPLYSEDLNVFFNSEYFKSKKPEDYVFPKAINYYRRKLKEVSNKAIRKELTPHCLRHSSATYYASISGDSVLLAEKYGWRFNSRELNLYIRRSGHRLKKTTRVVYQTRIDELERKLERLQKITMQLYIKGAGAEQEREQAVMITA